MTPEAAALSDGSADMDQAWVRRLPVFLRRRLEGQAALQRTVENAAWLLADNLVRMGIGFVIGVRVARHLGPSDFGAYSYALAFVALFTSVASLGLDTIVVRELVRNPAQEPELLGSAFLLKLVGGTLTLVLSVTGVLLLGAPAPIIPYLVAIVAATTLPGALDVIDLWFQSQTRSRYTVWARNGGFLLATLLRIALLVYGASLLAFVAVALLESCLASAGLVLVYRLKAQSLRRWKPQAAVVQRLLRESWPVVLGGLAVYVQARIDQVMLGEMLGTRELGTYCAALRIVDILCFIPVVIQSSVAPGIARARARDEGGFHDRLLNIYRLMFTLFLVVAVPTFLLSEAVVGVIYGAEYHSAGRLLGFLTARLFFTSFAAGRTLFIANENLFRFSLLTAAMGALTNVALNYVLIPRYASLGALGAMLASFAVTTFLLDVFSPRLRKNLKLMLLAVLTPWRLRLTSG